MTNRLAVFVLGGFRVERDGTPVPEGAWKRKPARTLVKVLAVTPGHRLHREQLQELLWPEQSPTAAEAALYVALHHARRALEPGLAPRAASTSLRLAGTMVVLDTTAVHVDADAFEEAASVSLASDTTIGLESALQLYTGELLPEDRYEEWALERRDELAALYLRCLIELGKRLDTGGRWTDAQGRFEEALDLDPANEEIHRSLMALYAAHGSRHRALQQYERCKQILWEQLEVEPEDQTVRLYSDIRDGVFQDETSPPSAFAPVASPVLPSFERPAAPGIFVGRERALDALRRELGSGRLVAIVGEAGVGKTRLAVEAAREAALKGTAVLWGAAYEAEARFPYGPFADALRRHVARLTRQEQQRFASDYPELLRLAPILRSDEPPLAGDPRTEQGRIYAGMSRLLADLASRHSLFLLLDDLHLAGPESLQLLHYLARLAPDHGWLLAATYREEDLGSDLRTVLSSLHGAGLYRQIDLLRLGRPETEELVRALLPEAVGGESVVQEVYARSLGNPLFAIELVGVLREHGGSRLSDADVSGTTLEGARREVPHRVRDLVETRVQSLGEQANGVLRLAATAGSAFSFDLLVSAAADVWGLEMSEGQLLDALDGALRQRILDERGDIYAFRHPLFREALYAGLSHARRRRLHRALGLVLERDRTTDIEELAYHFGRSNDDERAALYLIQAGDRAKSLFANEAAVAYYTDALERLGRLRRELEAGQVRLRLAEVLAHLGRYDAGLIESGAATEVFHQAEDPAKWSDATAVTGQILFLRGSSSEARTRIESAIETMELQGRSTNGLAQLYHHLGLAHFHAGRYADALEAAQRVSDLAELLDDDLLRLRGSQNRGIALMMLGRLGEGRDPLTRANELAARMGDLRFQAIALTNLGGFLHARGELTEAATFRSRGVEVASHAGDPSLLTFCASACAWTFILLGRLPEARVYVERAMQTARRFPGVRDAYAAWAMGMLAFQSGWWDEAVGLLDEVVSAAERTGDLQLRFPAVTLLAERERREGQPKRARARLEDLLQAVGPQPPYLTGGLLARLAHAQLDGGDLAGAARLSARAERLLRGHDLLLWLPDALRVKGLVRASQDRWEEADDAFQEAIVRYSTMPYPQAEAEVRLSYGVALLRRDETAGIGEIARARSIFRDLGASRDEEEAASLLP